MTNQQNVSDHPCLSFARLAGLATGLLALILFFLAAPVAWADSIDVTTEQDIIDANKGTCVGLTPLHLPGPDGLNSLREAICAANTNPGPDTITLGPGAFRLFRLGADDTGQDGDLDILAKGGNLTIQGAGSADSVISGLGCVAGTDRIFHVDPSAAGGFVVNFEGLTVRKGCTTDGGGIRMEGGNTVNLTDCIVSENQVVGEYSIGGGILQLQGTLTLSATQVLTNYGSGSYVSSQSAGGGIYSASGTTLNISQSTVAANQISAQNLTLGAGICVHDSLATIERSEVHGNKVMGNDARGGGIAVRPGTILTISDSAIYNNESDGRGGAIDNDAARLFVNNSSIAENKAADTGGGLSANWGTIAMTDSVLYGNKADREGGGAFNDNGTLTLTNTLIDQNTTERNGGGIANRHAGNLSVSNSTFLMNTANFSGGGVSTDRGAVSITNSTFSDNRANEFGGGLFHWAETADLSFTTFSENVADDDGDGIGDGGGLFVVADTLNLNNSIVAGNIDRGGQAPDCGGVIASHGDNIVRDDNGCTLGGSGANRVGEDPRLDVLAYNGGPPQLLTYALLKGSPALDAVTACDDMGGSPVVVDERGVARPKLAICDIGAYEWEGYSFYLPIVLRD